MLASDTLAFQVPLQSLAPAGSLVYRGETFGTFQDPDETDSLSILLDGSQRASVLVTPADPSLRVELEVRDEFGGLVTSATAAAPGVSFLVNGVEISTTQTISLRASNLEGVGSYIVSVFLNADQEVEPNNLTAQSLLPTGYPLGNGAERFAAVGATGPGDEDWYSLPLVAGQRVNWLLASEDSAATFELYDSSGLVALSHDSSVGQVIDDLVVPADGEYFARVRGLGAAASVNYQLVVTRDATLARTHEDSRLTASGVGLGTLGGFHGALGQIRVAVQAGDYAGDLLDQLNDDTFFDFEAVPVTSADIDSVDELQQFDVVVLGQPFEVLTFPAAVALRAWYEAGLGGVVGAAWLQVSADFFYDPATLAELDAVIPIQLTGDEVFEEGPVPLVVDTAHPVTQGLSDLVIPNYSDTSSLGADPGARVLGTTPSFAAIVVSQSPGRRSAYLSPPYFWDDRALLSGGPDQLLEQAVAWAAGGVGAQRFTFAASEGAELQISTQLLGEGLGQPDNTLDPGLELFYLDGAHPDVPVASDDNSADGVNALLSYVVPAGAGGTYMVRLRSVVGEGDYLVSVSGADEPAIGPAPQAESAIPGNAASVTVFPNVYRVVFDRPLLASSIDAGDLLINGQPAAGVTLFDDRTLDFSIATLNAGSQIYDVAIPAGAISALDGADSAAFATTFSFDDAPPTVVSTSVGEGQVLPPGNVEITIEFSEPLNAAVLNSADVALVNLSTGASFGTTSFHLDESGQILTLDYASLSEGGYELRLFSSSTAFVDLSGNRLDGDNDGDVGDDFVRTFSVDQGTRAYPAPLEAKSPRGGLIYDPQVTGALGSAADTDEFTIDLEAEQLLSVVVTPTAGLMPTLTVLDSMDNVVASRTASGEGVPVVLQTQLMLAGGTYRLVVGAAGANGGGYSVRLVLNAAIEMEGAGGPRNDTRATAEDFATSSIPLQGSADRLGVLGRLNPGLAVDADQADVYRVALAAGQATTIVVTTVDGELVPLLELYDSAGTLLAMGIGESSNTAAALRDLVVEQSGDYYVRVASNLQSGEYSLLAMRGADFEHEPNSVAGDAQDISLAGQVLGAIGGEGNLSSLRNVAYVRSIASAPWGSSSNETAMNNVFGAGHWNDLRFETVNAANLFSDEYSFVYLEGSDSIANELETFITANRTRMEQFVAAGHTLLVNAAPNEGDGMSFGFGGVNLTYPSLTPTASAVDLGHPIFQGPFTPVGSSYSGNSFGHAIVTGPGLSPILTRSGGDMLLAEKRWGAGLVLFGGMTTPNFHSPQPQSNNLRANIIAYTAVGGGDAEDYYSFTVGASDTIDLTTTTPGDSAGEPFNDLDPILDLYYLDGPTPDVPVASNDNGAADGRNAHVTYTVPSGAEGSYLVAVRTAAGSGPYTLRAAGGVPGSIADTSQMAVVASTPVSGAKLQQVPATYRVTFNHELLLTSVEPADLTVNGIAASSFTVVDGRTLDFTISNAASGDGSYLVNLAAGAVSSVSGRESDAYSASFNVDGTGPRVIASSVSEGDVLAPGNLTYQVQFNEALAESGLGADDVVLTRVDTGAVIAASAFSYLAGTSTATMTFNSLTEGVYRLSLRSSATGFRDLLGNLLDGAPSSPLPSGGDGISDDYTVNFVVDVSSRPFPIPLNVKLPLGGLIYDPAATGSIGFAGDTDGLVLDLDANQLLTVVVNPQGGLQPTLSIIGPGDVILSGVVASAIGAPAVIQVQPITVGGTYRLVVGGSGATTGTYTASVTLNALQENEGLGGAANDSLAFAENLDPSSVALQGSASRLAALGQVSNSPSDAADFYRFTVGAGQFVSLALTNLATGAVGGLELLDASGTLMALGIAGGFNTGSAIQDYLISQAGTYFARVSVASSTLSYSLLVMRGASFDAEPNSLPEDAQDLGATGQVLGSIAMDGSGLDTPGSNVFLSTNLFDSAGFRWDIQQSGFMSDGTSDAYDGGMSLAGFGSFSTAATEAGGREIVIGPQISAGVEVRRKIYVPTNANFARYLEIVTNTTAAPVTRTVTINTNLGSDGGEQFVSTSSGDSFFTIDDNWLVTDDSAGFNDPVVTHVIAGDGALRPASASRSFDQVSYSYNLELAPGETKIVMHFAAQNSVRTTAVDQAATLAALQGHALDFVSPIEAARIVNFRANSFDQFRFDVTQGTTLSIRTTTPGGGNGQPVNDLVPAVDLYFVDGATPDVPVATNDHGAPDGHNALLNYVVPADAVGRYRAVVRGISSTGGDYTLEVQSSTTGAVVSAAGPFQVSATTPAAGGLLLSFPTTYRLSFNQGLQLTSVQASDLRINGQGATAVNVVDGRTLEFTVDSLNEGDGVYNVTLAPGVLRSVSGTPVDFFSTTFEVDATAPRVIASSIDEGDAVSTGSLTYQVQFSEPLAEASLGAEDVQLVRTDTPASFTPASFAYDPTTSTATVTFEGLAEGTYQLRLRSAADGFRDRRGNLLDGAPSFPLPSGGGPAGDDFVVNFSADTLTQEYPALVVAPPIGGLVYDPSVTGFISPTSDTDTFTLHVEQGQLISALVVPVAGLKSSVTLIGPTGTTLDTVTAAAAGQSIAIQARLADDAGTYRVVVSGADGTTGGYALQVVLNALIERESLGGESNGLVATAEDIAASAMTLSGDVKRWGVTGQSSNESDYFRLAMTAGHYATIALAPLSGTVSELELLDSAGRVLARGLSSEASTQFRIHAFATSNDDYRIRVRGQGLYSLVVTQDAALDQEPNGDPQAPQRLEGALGALGGIQTTNDNLLVDFTGGSNVASLEGFTATGLWHVTDQVGANLSGHSTPHIAYFGFDASGSFDNGQRVSGTLTSGPLTLGISELTQLQMKYRLQGEAGTTWDRAEVRVSTNGGASFTTVATKATHFALTSTWTAATIDLSAYAGQTVLLQFSFDSIDGVANSSLGWQIDDLLLTGLSDRVDHYRFSAGAGDQLTIRTYTPGDATGEPVNDLDPILDLFNEAGDLVATNDNGAADGRNAQLSYTTIAAGTYTVAVRSNAAAGGVYQLQIEGSTAENLFAPVVTNVAPPNAGPLSDAPTQVTLTFSEGLRLDSLQASDLEFLTPGVSVTAVQVIDGRTVRFDVSVPGAAGLYEYRIASGSVLDLQGLGNLEFDGSFVVDRQGPRVVSTNPATQASAPFTSVTFEFDEPVALASVGTNDVVSFTGPGGVNLLGSITGASVNGNLVTVTFSQQLTPGSYSMTIGPNIQDLVGNLMDQNGNGTGGGAGDTYTVNLQLQRPDLAVFDVSTEASAQFGQLVDVTYTVRNIGDDPAVEGWQDAVYLSTDGVLDRDDRLLLVAPADGVFGPLDASGGGNDRYTRTVQVQIPLELSSTPGSYRLLVAADVNRRQPESSEVNNAGASGNLSLSLPPLPDLVVSNIVAPIEALSGQDISITWTITNQGAAEFTGTLRDNVYLSSDNAPGADQFFNNFDFTGTIAGGGSITRTQLIHLPIDMEGPRWVVITTDGLNNAFEHAGENNNTQIDNAPIQVRLQPFPNLRVTSVNVPENAFSSQQTVVSWIVTNVGTGSTNASIWYDTVYLSTDDVLDDLDVALATIPNASYLNAGENYSNEASVTLPRGISGPYHFIVKTDYYNQVYEHVAENDNVRSGSTTNVQLTPPPDLQVTAVNAPAQAFSGQLMSLSWVVANLGPGQTLESAWNDTVYMSSNNVLDGSDLVLGTFGHLGALLATQSYPANASVSLPIGISGDFYIFVRSDTFNQVYEHVFENNNIGFDAFPVHINLTPPPDLQVTSVSAPAIGVANHVLSVNYRVANNGATETPNSSWIDALYLSADTTLDPGDFQLSATTHYGVLQPGDEYLNTIAGTLPVGLTGTFYVFVATDRANQVFELDDSNNWLYDVGSGGDPGDPGHDPGTVEVSLQRPDLVVQNFSAPANGESGGSILVSWTVANSGIGDSAVSSWYDSLILSSNSVYGDADDIHLADPGHSGLLAVDTTYSQANLTVPIPLGVAPGNYFLFVAADFAGQVPEVSDLNNVSSPRAITLTRSLADLRPGGVTAVPSPVESGDQITVSWNVQNQGAATTNSTYWYDAVILSRDAILGGADDLFLQSPLHVNTLASGGSYSVSRAIDLPGEISGVFHVFVVADYYNHVFEDVGDANNAAEAVATVEVTLRPAPDLRITNVDAPASAFAGQNVTINWTVLNAGPGDATPEWYETFYLSLDQIFDNGDRYIGYAYRPQALLSGQSYNQSASFAIPPGIAGQYYVFAFADTGGAVIERTAEGNNIGYDPSSMQINLLPPADLVAGTIVLPANAAPGRPISVTYTVENQGTNPAIGAWTDSLYISADDHWDVGDPLLGRVDHFGDVAGGSSYSHTLNAAVPGVLPGTYHVIVRSDILNRLPEISEANNIAASLDRVDVDAEALVLGVPDDDTLASGQSAFYKIDLPVGETARFSFDGEALSAGTEVYVRYGAMPSRNTFDFAANEPFLPDQTLTIPVEQAGTYYVLVYRSNLSGSPNYSIRADLVPFSLARAVNSSGGDSGAFTVKVEGARFSPETEFELVNGAGTAFGAVRAVIQDSVTAYVTFDLTLDGAIGAYTLRARRGATTVSLATPFILEETLGADVVTNVDAPNSLRPNRSYTFLMQYANQGNQDTAAPLLLMESLTGTPIGLSASSQVSGVPLQVLGVAPDGPRDVLRPGARGSVQVNFATQSVATGVEIRLRHILADNETTITDAEWTQIEASIRPTGLTDAQWNDFWARIRPRIGGTWGAYVQFLNQVLNKVGEAGDPNYDIKFLMHRLYEADPIFRPNLIARGRLFDSDSGNPLGEIQLTAYRVEDGEYQRLDEVTTAADGSFQLEGLQPGNYQLAIEQGWRFDQDRNGANDIAPVGFTILPDQDLTAVSAYARPEANAEFPVSISSPALSVDADGVTHVVYVQGSAIWHAYFDDGNWVGAKKISDEVADSLSLHASSNLVGGLGQGLVATWLVGNGNETEVHYAIGRPNGSGGYEWTDPIALTSDSTEDGAPSVTVLSDGRILVVYSKNDDSIQDDRDLYYDAFLAAPANFPNDIVVISGGATLDPEATSASINYTYETSDIFGLIKEKLQVQGQAGVDGCELTLTASGNTVTEVDTVSSTGTLSGGATWAANKDTCDWDFKKATLGLSGSLGYDWKGGLFYVLERIPQTAPIAFGLDYAFTLLDWFTPIQISNGVDFSVGLSGELGWSFQAPFPSFVLPDSGSLKANFGIAPYIKAELQGIEDADAKLSGKIDVSVQILPTAQLDKVTGTIEFSAHWKDWVFTKSWSTDFFSASSVDSLEALGDELDGIEWTYDPTVAIGTSNVYGANSVLSNVAGDLWQDNTPSLASDGSGAFAAWSKAGDPFAEIGDSIVVADYNGATWSAPETIPNSSGLNRDVKAVSDGFGNRLVVWSSSDASTLGPDSTSAEITAAREATDVYFSVDDGSGWSSPLLLASTPGSDAGVTATKLSDGSVWVGWSSRTVGGDFQLTVARWNGTTWSAPQVVTTGSGVTDIAISQTGADPFVMWSQNVGGSGGAKQLEVFSSTLSGGSWSAPGAFNPMVVAGLSAAGVQVVTSSSSPAGSASLTTSGSLFGIEVPEDCCNCNRPEPPPPPDCGTYQTLNHETCEYETHYKPCVVQPRDPNDILGPDGFGDEHWLPADQKIPYTIRFENAPTATAPAQHVEITQTLDEDLNPSSFRLGNFGFGDLIVTVPENKAFYNTRIDLTATKGYFVDVAAGIDVATRQAFWRLTTIDPGTGELPLDANIGFLPVNDAEGAGEGFVSYSVKPKTTVQTGDRVDAQARIVFDTEGPIDTPPIFHTLDADKPTSVVAALPASVPDASFDVSWSGQDDDAGSGLAYYSIFVSTDGGDFDPWLENTTLTSATYVGEAGHIYAFYSIAADNAGNIELPPGAPDAQTATPGAAATIGDFVWHDVNGNGIQDAGEAGLPDVVVHLFRADDTLVSTTTTGSLGEFEFSDLSLGDQYYLEFVAPVGYAFSDANQGADDAIDSDANVNTGRTSLVTVANGANSQWDAGLFLLGAIGGSLWNDADGDGARDEGELPLVDWRVYLDLNDNGQLDIDLDEPFDDTDAAGNYRFEGLRPGQYIVAQQIPAGWEQTFPGAPGAASSQAGFQHTGLFTGSDVEMAPPASIEVDTSATADCGCGSKGSTGTGTSPSTSIPIAANGFVESGAAAATDLINLDDLQADQRFAGLNGHGYSVVVIDTGIDVDHPFFGPDADGDGVADRIVYQYDFADNDADASDRSGHGSNVTSILAGQGTYPGIVSGANIIALKVFGDNGRGFFSSLERALSWVVRNASIYNIAAVNLSVGDGLNWASSTGLYGVSDELAALADLHVITVAAAGNNYAVYHGAQGLAYPAADPNAIAVGAVWADNEGGPWSFGGLGTDYTTAADRIASFSQRDDRMLDILAPGAVIEGANATGGVSSMRGTSMAAPYVTGAAVLAQEIAERRLGRSLSLAEFRYLLQSSGAIVVDGDDEQDSVPNTGLTFRRLNLHALAEAVEAYDGNLPPQETPPAEPTPGGPVGTQSARPFRYTVSLAAEQVRDDVHFGDQFSRPQITDVAAVIPNPRNQAVDAVEVTFSEPIDLATLNAADLSLSRGGVSVVLEGDDLSFERLGTSTTYRVSGLGAFTSAEGAYELTIHAEGISDLVGIAGTGSATVNWLMDATAPSSVVNALPRRQSSLTFEVSVTGSDPASPTGTPASGVSFFDVFFSVDNGPFSLWQSLDADHPSGLFTGQSNHTYAFRSVARDAAGNVEQQAGAIEATTYVPDLVAPRTQVDSVDSATANFAISFSGTDSGGSQLKFFDVFVEVDGGAAALVGRFAAGSPNGSGVQSGSASYVALVDGLEHTYRFYSIGIDLVSNTETAPDSETDDVVVTRTFVAAAPLSVSGFDVQRGAQQRSFARYIDVAFNRTDGVQQLMTSLGDADTANDRVRLRRFNLDGSGAGDAISLAGRVQAVDQVLSIDFGLDGIGGNRNTSAGDGYYALDFDLDGNGSFETTRHFYRLLGDVNGDRRVTDLDATAITLALGRSGSPINEDANGDGVVNANDRTLALRARDRALGSGLFLDD